MLNVYLSTFHALGVVVGTLKVYTIRRIVTTWHYALFEIEISLTWD